MLESTCVHRQIDAIRRSTSTCRAPIGAPIDLWAGWTHERLQREALPFLAAEAGRPVEMDAELAMLLDLLRPRSDTFVDMARRARFFLSIYFSNHVQRYGIVLNKKNFSIAY